MSPPSLLFVQIVVITVRNVVLLEVSTSFSTMIVVSKQLETFVVTATEDPPLNSSDWTRKKCLVLVCSELKGFFSTQGVQRTPAKGAQSV